MAQIQGFKRADVDFRIKHPHGTTVHTPSQLEEIAGTLLRGCNEHFEASVTRVSKVSAAVPVERRNEFIAQARALVDTDYLHIFEQCCKKLREDFPGCSRWLDWWLLPANSAMLFPAHFVMKPELALITPESTNAGSTPSEDLFSHWKKSYFACWPTSIITLYYRNIPVLYTPPVLSTNAITHQITTGKEHLGAQTNVDGV